MNDLDNYSEIIFEDIKHVNEYEQEFWLARELQVALGYTEWHSFSKVIEKAKIACAESSHDIDMHFVPVSKLVPLPNGGEKIVEDFQLSRFACYLTVMNGYPRKKAVALGQTYFAIKTRQQELISGYNTLSEDQKRLAIRKEIARHNKSLARTAKQAGVIDSTDYAKFQNAGYQGLYGGLDAKELHARKKLKKSQKILDHMGSTELAANLFRATQTDEKLRRENIKGKESANQAHYDVGQKVRQTIKDLGGTMPEDLPIPAKSIRQIEREQKKLEEQ